MGSKRKRDSSATRRRILSAALKIFSRQGYHGATTKEISRASGVNEALIFRYFGSKRKLLMAVIDSNRLESAVPPFDKAREHSVVSFLELAAENAFRAYEDNPMLYRLLRFTQLENPELLAGYHAYLVRSRIEPFIQFLSRAREEALIRSDLPADLQARFFGALVGYVLEQRILGGNATIRNLGRKACIELVVDVFLQGANPLAFRPSTRGRT